MRTKKIYRRDIKTNNFAVVISAKFGFQHRLDKQTQCAHIQTISIYYAMDDKTRIYVTNCKLNSKPNVSILYKIFWEKKGKRNEYN